MSKKMGRVAQNVLNELHSTTDAIEALHYFMEQLENKEDPEPVELYMIENIYHFIEKMRIMEGNIKSYVKNINENTLPGNKLHSLHNTDSHLEDLKNTRR